MEVQDEHGHDGAQLDDHQEQLRNSADTFSFTNSSTRIMWPVEEMGSHSVMPSTTPMKNAFRTSSL